MHGPQKRGVAAPGSCFRMFRFDLSNLAVLSLAVAAALSAAFWLNRLTGPGEAQAASPVPVVRVFPPAPASGGPSQIVRAADGHYWAEARIDGRAVRLMVDTGASTVALTRDDAARLGLRPTPSDFGVQVQTAAGPTRAARVRLASVSVGGTRVDGVEALVIEDGLPHSLLGMSYLGQLSRFEATPHELILRP